jgi:uncharacterized protein YrrD
MFVSEEGLRNLHVDALDGYFGKIDEFYFEEKSWAVRYIIIIYGFLHHVRKMISPSVIENMSTERIAVKLNIEQIKNSPDIDTQKPVSRELEEKIHKYYGWPNYWTYPPYTNTYGTALYPGFGLSYPYSMPLYRDRDKIHEEMNKDIKNIQSNLRSTKELIGYSAKSRNQYIGRIKDYLVDDKSWALRYTIIDTDSFLSGKKIIIASHWAIDIDWFSKTIFFDIDEQVIKNGPSYENSMVLDRDFESRIFDYYNKPYYWE